jgi:hypothetical protein
MCQRAAKPQQRRVLVRRAPDGVLELGQAALCAAQHEQRQALADIRVPARAPLAERQRLRDQPFGALELPFHERELRAGGAQVPSLGRLAQLVGEHAQGLELDLHAGAITEHPEGLQSVVVAREDPLFVADLLAQRDQPLALGDAVAAGESLRSLDREPLALESGGEGHGVADPPGDLHRLLGQVDPALAPGIVAPCGREPGEQHDSRVAVLLAGRRQGALQQRNQGGVGAGARPGEPPAVRERRSCELV